MGGFVSKAVNENMKMNQDFMIEMNRITVRKKPNLEEHSLKLKSKCCSKDREADSNAESDERKNIARTRELLNWFGTFYTVAAAGMLTGFHRSRKPGVLVPLLPLTFILGYQIDMAYGNKLLRIKHEAENIIKFESELLDLPMKLPTLSTIDMARQVQHDKLLMHSAEPPLYY